MSVDALQANAARGVDPARLKIAGSIKQAANATGTSFQYLLATAKMESDFNPTAAASTSSAHGLYQFIDQTWLGTVKEAGAQLGYGRYADAISRTSSGGYTVDDPAARQAIMKLRDDPDAASAMAGALTQSNSFKLTGRIGRRPTDSELYMAHFMGVGGAAKLINAKQDTPGASAASMFPNAAAANRSIFYDRDGRARSVSDVYGVLDSRFASAAGSNVARAAIARYGDGETEARSAVASIGQPAATDNATYLSMFPDMRPGAGATRSAMPVATESPVAVPASSNTIASAARSGASTDPMFRSLFQVDDRAPAVSQRVQELWGSTSGRTASAQLPSQPNVRPPSPLDLFSDRNGTYAG